MEFITSNKGKTKVLCDGYIYVKQKNLANGVILYECDRRRSQATCKAKIKILNNEIIDKLNQHTHASDKPRCEAAKVGQVIKKRAQETLGTTQQIIAEACGGQSEEVIVKLPPLHHLGRNVRRYRQISESSMPLPTSTDSLVIPENLAKTPDGEKFILQDYSSVNGKRIIILGTEKSLEFLANSQHWFFDGTFKVVPDIFAQLYTIHALIEHHTIPCIYALLPDKTQATYNEFLQAVKNFKNFTIKSAMIDFEKAMLNSLISNFPGLEVQLPIFFSNFQCN